MLVLERALVLMGMTVAIAMLAACARSALLCSDFPRAQYFLHSRRHLLWRHIGVS